MYSGTSSNWPAGDGWNAYKRKRIGDFIVQTGTQILKNARRILDAGAGDTEYEWMPSRVSLDRHYFQLHQKENAVVGDIEQMPFADGSFDLVVCVGSVLNYASAAETLSEISRVTARNGFAYIHFESSKSFEQLFLHSWGAAAVLNKTINGTRDDYIWIYSPEYIASLLRGLDFNVVASARFHILSSLCCRFGVAQTYAHYAARLDWLGSFLRRLSDDMIILAQRGGRAIDELGE